MPASNLMPSNGYFNIFSWNYCYVKCFSRITKLSRGKVKKDHKKWTSGHFSKTLSPPPRWISGHFGPNIFFLFFAFLFLIKLEVSGPYGPLTSSPCGGLACCTQWGPLGPHWHAVHDGALWATIARVAGRTCQRGQNNGR